jgi:SAM-dependent methyltransferase
MTRVGGSPSGMRCWCTATPRRQSSMRLPLAQLPSAPRGEAVSTPRGTFSARLARLASTQPSRFVEQQTSFLDARLPVLDAPCGFGRNSFFLAEQGYRVIALDIDRERINFVASRARSERRREKNLSFAICALMPRACRSRRQFWDIIDGGTVPVHRLPVAGFIVHFLYYKLDGPVKPARSAPVLAVLTDGRQACCCWDVLGAPNWVCARTVRGRKV